MNPTDLDHDARRELEQRALRNVSWLAAKLGYQDALDRRQERTLIMVMGVALVVIVALMVVSAMSKGSAEEGDLVRKRCEVDMRVQATDSVRAQVLAEHPEMSTIERQGIFEDRIHAIAASKCGNR